MVKLIKRFVLFRSNQSHISLIVIILIAWKEVAFI